MTDATLTDATLADSDVAVMLCGHGSRDPEASRQFEAAVALARDKAGGRPVEHGYLEFARPILAEGLDALRRGGARRIVAVPCMLFAAGHAKNDIPSVLRAYGEERDDMRIDYAKEIGFDAGLLRLAERRILAALSEAGVDPADREARRETLLLVIGRGASDPDANGNVAKIARMLVEGLGFGWGEVGYSGVTFPSTDAALERASMLGFSRMIVFPYFLFAGILVTRIYDAVERARRTHSEIEILSASYLGVDDAVADVLLERAAGVLRGDDAMNCSLCKYRQAIPGFEAQVGEPQVGHHGHVEGIGHGHHNHDHAHDHDHAHAHAHGHSHAHAPYPHADHPLGPRSIGGADAKRTKPTTKPTKRTT